MIAALSAALGEAVTDLTPVAGGDINDAFRARLRSGGDVFVKTSPAAPAGMFSAEAAGLRWLAQPGVIDVAQVLAVGDAPDAEVRFLALRWIERGRLDAPGEEALGRGLAALHRAGAPCFGGEGPLRLGALTIANDPLPDWPAFYSLRLQAMLAPAVDRGAADGATAAAVERVCERMPQLTGPAEPPARLHGDLWAGNVMARADGMPVLIDPLAYGGHREIDLAMLRLFGGPSQRCFDAYDEVFPLADGHEDRIELCQLFPLLVHAVLFGGSYGAQVARAARRYA